MQLQFTDAGFCTLEQASIGVMRRSRRSRLERTGRQLLEPGALRRKMLGDNALGRGVYRFS